MDGGAHKAASSLVSTAEGRLAEGGFRVSLASANWEGRVADHTTAACRPVAAPDQDLVRALRARGADAVLRAQHHGSLADPRGVASGDQKGVRRQRLPDGSEIGRAHV